MASPEVTWHPVCADVALPGGGLLFNSYADVELVLTWQGAIPAWRISRAVHSWPGGKLGGGNRPQPVAGTPG